MKVKKILIDITFILCFFSILLAGADISDVFEEDTPPIFKQMSRGEAAWADFRGNGWWDLAVSGVDGTGRKVYLYRNEAGEGFSIEKEITVEGEEAAGIAWGDYNNSGMVDLIVAGWETTHLYENKGGGNFVNVPVSGLDVTREAKVAWADFNNDGLMDLAIIGQDISRVYRNNGNGTFTPYDLFSPDVIMGLHAIAWADYNNSGYPDLLITGPPTGIAGQAEIYLFENKGDETFSSRAEAKVNAGSLSAVEYGDVAWGDLNNNGFLDLVIAGRRGTGDNVLIVYENQGTAGNYELVESTSLTGIRDASLALADVNNNSRLDIIAMGDTGEGYKTFIYINEGNFAFDEKELYTGMHDGALALADCTGTRMTDLYIHGSNQVKLYRNKVEGKEPPKPVSADEMHSVYYLDTLYIMWNPPEDVTDEYYYNFRIGEEEGADNLAPARYGSPLLGNYLSKATTNTHQESRIKSGQIPDMEHFKYIRAVEVSGSNYHWAVQSIDASLGFTWGDAAGDGDGWSENKIFIDTTPPTGYPVKPLVEGEYTYDRNLIFTLDRGSSEDMETRIFGAYLQLQEIEHGGVFNEKDNIIEEKEIWPGSGPSVWGESGTFEYEHKGSYDKSYRIRVKARHGYSMHFPFAVYLTTMTSGYFDYYGGYNYEGINLSTINTIGELSNVTGKDRDKIEQDFADWHFNPASPHYTSAGPDDGWSEWSDPITPVRLLTVENNLITQPGVHTVDIGYFALERGRATIRVFDIMGNHIITLLDERVDSGVRKFIQWNGLNSRGKAVASGIYYINIQVPDGEDTSKVAIVK